MNTLMIVEDEKMIRQGIAAMAKRTNVPIARILECRNGQEALEVLEREDVDALFTDIRMPKMNGIALVEEIRNQKKNIQIGVISGYDDFNYAVEMLKHGVVDYILKPIKREKIQEVLEKMEDNIKREQQKKSNSEKMILQQLDRFLSGTELEKEAGNQLFSDLADLLGHDGYMVAVTGDKGAAVEVSSACRDMNHVLILEKMNAQTILIFGESEREAVKDRLTELKAGFVLGKAVCRTPEELRSGYQNAMEERILTFVRGEGIRGRETAEDMVEPPEVFAEKFARQFPTDRFERAVKELHNLYFKARHGKYRAQDIVDLNRCIWAELWRNYPEVSEKEQDILSFRNLEEYEKYETQCFEQMKRLLKERMDVDRNQEKVYRAIEYIKENYHTDLNMATVSNYVSMNYSLFSIVFKEYTGVNFVNYLKRIRIEEAKMLLETTDKKIQEISRLVGYENEKHFMKTFRTLCGVSPSEYRKNSRLH